MNSARANHGEYVKHMLAELLGDRFCTWFEELRSYDMGGVKADLDGLVRSADRSEVQCAVEIEAKGFKQIRGAILDLAWHTAPKKLLIVVKAQPQLKSKNTEQVRAHCNYVWGKLLEGKANIFGLVVLEGTGSEPMERVDRNLLESALRELQLLTESSPND
jgi:hypothetical protein